MVREKQVDNRTNRDLFFDIDEPVGVNYMEHDAERVMTLLENKLSRQLLLMLNQQLLGFGSSMQQELAMDMVDYVCNHIVRTTGCPSADCVLEICYAWIAEEKGGEA